MESRRKSGDAGALTPRLARRNEEPALTRLIEASARAFCRRDYTADQVEGALGTAWAVDSQLIEDGTYFVLESDDGELVACGGWSWRGTLFGGDNVADRADVRLDPQTDAARIRAFFVHPDWGRQGLGTWLLDLCEKAAREAGFRRAELVATLTGEHLYARHGYRPQTPIEHPLPSGGTIRFVPMTKELPTRHDDVSDGPRL